MYDTRGIEISWEMVEDAQMAMGMGWIFGGAVGGDKLRGTGKGLGMIWCLGRTGRVAWRMCLLGLVVDDERFSFHWADL